MTVYLMEVKGDYYMNELIEQRGVKSGEELIDFATSYLSKGSGTLRLTSRIRVVPPLL